MKKVITIFLCILLLSCTLITSASASEYSANNAIAYSDKYATSRNTINTLGVGYNDYSPRDCTNFVSQCLSAGGLRQDTIWKSIVEWHGNTAKRVDSVAWIQSQELKTYFVNSKRATKLGSWSLNGSGAPYQTYAYVNNSNNLSAANAGKVVVFYDWNGDGNMNHAAFYMQNNGTSTYSGEGKGDLINQHSEDRHHVLWRPDIRQKNAGDTRVNITRVYAFELNV